MHFHQSETFQKGIRLLAHPVLPLVRILQFLYLTAPVDTVAPLLDEFTEPVETGFTSYENPQALLAPYLPILAEFERLKKPAPLSHCILSEDHEEMAQFEALELWVSQQVLTRELETINSLLCGPCHCMLCCVGPDRTMAQSFFEIPLLEQETALFDIARVETCESQILSPLSEPPLVRDGKPFYETEPALYRWKTGWSMILPKESSCPQLDPDSGACRIYPTRPEVCRRPQIFPYVIERAPAHDREVDGRQQQAFISRRKILAIWDCPYVQALKDEIAAFAEACELEPVFKSNKA